MTTLGRSWDDLKKPEKTKTEMTTLGQPWDDLVTI
jgi:hypothetical protein